MIKEPLPLPLPPVEELAKAIQDIAIAARKISATRLTRRALVTLIQAESKVPKRDIELVLNNLEQMDRTWLKAKPLPK